MRRMNHVFPLATVVFLAAAASAMAAVSSHPVRARLERPSSFAVAGREFTGVVIVEAARAATLRDIELAGDGWIIRQWDGPRDKSLTAVGEVRWTFRALPGWGFGPLVLSAQVDGRHWQQTFQLSAEDYGGLLPTDSDLLPPRRLLPASGENLPEAPQLTLAELTVLARDDAPAPSAELSLSQCSVVGTVRYWYSPGNKYLPAFGASVLCYVYPQNDFPYVASIAWTDEQGRFTLQAPTGARVSVRFKASSGAVVVQEDGVWEDDYQWQTATFTIPPGTTEYGLGALQPNSHAGALHIMTVLTYTRDYFSSLGWGVGRIDLQWPDADGSFYESYWEEIHLVRGDEWEDGTITHEWGHYWNHMHAHFPNSGYELCNGICDTDPANDKCGHCMWCPESALVTWIEGVAQVISRLSTEDLVPRVAFNVRHKGIEAPQKNDTPGCPWDPWHIEGVVAGAIWDIANNSRGVDTYGLTTDALGKPLSDQLAVGAAEILHVLTSHCADQGHQPYRMPGFFRCMAERLGNLGWPTATLDNLWETAMNWDLQLDDTAPATVPNLWSTFPLNTPTQTAVGGFYWNAPTDDLSGICGYSVAISPNAPALPDATVDATTRQWWTPGQLPPGTYYFSAIAIDRAGNGSATPSIFGPIIITAPGPADLTPITPSGWTAPLVLRSTLAPDAPNPVTQTNSVNGSSAYFNWGLRNTGTGPTGNFRDRAYIDGNLAITSNTRNLGAGVGGETRNWGPVALGVIGRHTVWMRLDGIDAVAESNEDNNVYAKQFVFTPQFLAAGATIVRGGGLPDAYAGQPLVPGGTTFYPNCDGFDVSTCIFPELVWAVPDDPNDRIVMRLHQRDTQQTGYANALATSISLADKPAAVLLNPATSSMYAYGIGVSDQSGSGSTYRIHREVGREFAMPDTIPGTLNAENCLDYYWTYNNLSQAQWFTIKLAGSPSSPLMMRFFHAGFTIAALEAANTTTYVAAGDTVHRNVWLEPGQVAATVVTRDPRLSGTAVYTIFAYNHKPDLAATRPHDWFANLVPHTGTPHNYQGSVPAPSTLIGEADTTSFYWSLQNLSLSAGVPGGLRCQVDLDGAFLFGNVLIGALPADHLHRAVNSTRYNVRGGRHTLAHRLNTNRGIDEDDFTNNHHGRQWVWSPRVLALGEVHSLPMAPDAYGGLAFVTEGLAAQNCDGYRFTRTFTINPGTVFAAYGVANQADIDIGLYSGADTQTGFATTHAQSTWNGPGADFVLRYLQGSGTFTMNVGLTRLFGVGAGDVTLRAHVGNSFWNSPAVGTSLSGTIAAAEFLQTSTLSLPPGIYRFTLRSDDAPLGFSLHDFSGGYSARTAHWQDGMAWQLDSAVGQDQSFVVSVPDPAPTRLCVAVWRPDATARAVAAGWTVTIGADLSGVDDAQTMLPTGSRLISAAPNPFNPQTELVFVVAQAGRCELTIHDVRGRLVRSLVTADLPAGRRAVVWDGLDDQGHRAASATYVARLRTGQGEVDLLKLTLVK